MQYVARKSHLLEINGTVYRCRSLCAFLLQNDTYYLKNFNILENGDIECDYELWSGDEFREAVLEGTVTTTVPSGGRIYIADILASRVQPEYVIVEPQEFLKEVADVVAELNGRRTTSDICRDAYYRYCEVPTTENLEALRKAYDAIPRHLDCFLLGQDKKDAPIRRVLGIP